MADNFASFAFSTQEDWYGELTFETAEDGAPLSLAGRRFVMLVTPAMSGAELVEPALTLTMETGGGLSLKEGDPSTLLFQTPRTATTDLRRIEYTADILEVVGPARYLFLPVRITYAEPSGLRAFLSRFLGVKVSVVRRVQPIVTPVAVAGRQGARGPGILSGNRPPAAGDGAVGDLWLDLETPDKPTRLYGAKTASGWPSTYLALLTDGVLNAALERATQISTPARFSAADGNLAAGQTSLTVPGGYTPGLVTLFRNGLVVRTSDYVATDGSKIVLASEARADDVIDVRSFRVGGIVNAAAAQHQHNPSDITGLDAVVRTMQTIDLASATTVDLGATNAGSVRITGTTTITGFGTVPNQIRFLRFAGALTLANSANLAIETGADLVTAAGDSAIAISNAAGAWTVRHYARANGYPLVTPQVIAGNTGATTIPAGSTRYFTVGNVSAPQSNVYVGAGRRGYFKNLRIITQGAPGAGESWTFTLQKLFSDTALTCTIGPGTNQAADLLNSVLFGANERWCIKIVSSAGAAPTSNILFSVVFEAND